MKDSLKNLRCETDNGILEYDGDPTYFKEHPSPEMLKILEDTPDTPSKETPIHDSISSVLNDLEKRSDELTSELESMKNRLVAISELTQVYKALRAVLKSLKEV